MPVRGRKLPAAKSPASTVVNQSRGITAEPATPPRKHVPHCETLHMMFVSPSSHTGEDAAIAKASEASAVSVTGPRFHPSHRDRLMRRNHAQIRTAPTTPSIVDR